VSIYSGDCNDILVTRVFPRIEYRDYKRGLCVLDPYGLTLDWATVQRAGEMRSIEVFINFPIMDINRNALWIDATGVSAANTARMTAFWGDDSWQRVAYHEQGNLFSTSDAIKKRGNKAIVAAYRKRLHDLARFRHVPEPVPMRNSKGAVVYYLFFASNNEVGARIAKALFEKHRNTGLR